jgi:hypothetical protein
MTKRSPDEFRRDIEMRQRNIVYPDTLRNEVRGWRSLITSKEPLSVLQIVGLLLLYLSVLHRAGIPERWLNEELCVRFGLCGDEYDAIVLEAKTKGRASRVF